MRQQVRKGTDNGPVIFFVGLNCFSLRAQDKNIKIEKLNEISIQLQKSYSARMEAQNPLKGISKQRGKMLGREGLETSSRVFRRTLCVVLPGG